MARLDGDALRAAATVLIGRRRSVTEVGPMCEPLRPGDEVASYVLEHQLAEGGMGLVFAAHHRYLGRAAALKVVHPDLDGYGRARERLLQEAQLLARLDHPGAVRVYDFGYLEDGRPWMAMELLLGTTLGERMAQGPLDHRTALAVLRAIAQTLSAAHHAGIVHRDLKPDNVWLGDDARTIKLLDWGIAYLREQRGERFTGLGMALGTPEYLAPEQARGLEVDGRADVYSLGVVAYELFAQRVPFQGSTAVDIAIQHLQQDPPALSGTGPDVPPRLEALIMTMLAKDRDHRPDIDEVDRELAAVETSL